MLSSVSRFGGSKGMVAMPNLSGLTQSAATTLIQQSGLILSSASNSSTSNSGDNGKVSSQSVSAGTLVDYETSVSIQVWFYQAPSGPTITLVEDPTEVTIKEGDAFCVTTSSPYLESQKYQVVLYTYRYIDGVKDTAYTPTYRKIRSADTVTVAYSSNCGWYPPPAVTCTTTTVDSSSWSSCSNGYREKYVKDKTVCSDGTTSYSNSRLVRESCCITISSETLCGSCICNSKTCTTTKDIMCGSTTRTETTTSDVSCISGSGTNCA